MTGSWILKAITSTEDIKDHLQKTSLPNCLENLGCNDYLRENAMIIHSIKNSSNNEDLAEQYMSIALKQIFKGTLSWELKMLTTPEIQNVLRNISLSACKSDADCIKYMEAENFSTNTKFNQQKVHVHSDETYKYITQSKIQKMIGNTTSLFNCYKEAKCMNKLANGISAIMQKDLYPKNKIAQNEVNISGKKFASKTAWSCLND